MKNDFLNKYMSFFSEIKKLSKFWVLKKSTMNYIFSTWKLKKYCQYSIFSTLTWILKSEYRSEILKFNNILCRRVAMRRLILYTSKYVQGNWFSLRSILRRQNTRFKCQIPAIKNNPLVFFSDKASLIIPQYLKLIHVKSVHISKNRLSQCKYY